MLSSGMSAVLSCASVLLLKHELCVEKKATMFREVPCGPLKCEDIKQSEQAPALSRTSERDDSVQVFLTLACRAWSTHGRHVCGSDALPVLLRPCSLIAPRAVLYPPPKLHVLLERPPRHKDVYRGHMR